MNLKSPIVLLSRNVPGAAGFIFIFSNFSLPHLGNVCIEASLVPLFYELEVFLPLVEVLSLVRPLLNIISFLITTILIGATISAILAKSGVIVAEALWTFTGLRAVGHIVGGKLLAHCR